MAILFSTGFFFVFALRVNLSVALVCMVEKEKTNASMLVSVENKGRTNHSADICVELDSSNSHGTQVCIVNSHFFTFVGYITVKIVCRYGKPQQKDNKHTSTY